MGEGLSTSSRTKLVVATSLVALVAVMIYVSVSGNQFSCEVCIEISGKTVCRTASGVTSDEARVAAADTACWMLAGAVTEGLACRNTAPKHISCTED